jgi:HlyD family secretion protein
VIVTEPAASPNPSQHAAARRRQTWRWIKRVLYTLIAFVVVGGIAFAWIPKPIPVDVAPVTVGPMRVTVDEDGHARVKDRYLVSAPIIGNLGRIELQPGDDVKAGQVLARIVPLLPPLLDERTRTGGEARVAGALAAQQQAGLQIERAQASVELVRNDVARLKSLAATGAAPRQQLEDATLQERRANAELASLRFAAQVADHEVAMARASLSRLRPGAKSHEELVVPSPVAGRVLKVHRESEGAVQIGAPLLEVGDPSALEIVIDVLTSDAVRVRATAPVRIDGWGGPPLDGQVRRVEPSAFTRLSALGVDEQRVNVLVDLTSPRERRAALGDGFRVEAHIVLWEADQVVQVPPSAVFRRGEGWALFREDGGKAHLVPVKLGERNAAAVQILDGVAPGTHVLLHPSDQVHDGARVQAR